MVRISRALIVLPFIAAGWWAARPRFADGPPRLGIWYWHTPFNISSTEAARLQRIGIRDIYVRAGTFVRNDESIRLTQNQEWLSNPGGLRIHLVFNFSYDIVRQFERLAPNMRATILDAIREQRSAAEAAGIRAAGIQLDFDCPTRLLPVYARLLRELRPELKTGDFSITALPTWLRSSSFREVTRSVDYFVPQFYESQIPRSLDHFATISRLPLFESGLQSAEKVGTPYFAGIPAYGHALVYDGHGKLMGVYHDVGVREARRDSRFTFARSFASDAFGRPADASSYCGEDIVQYDARPDESGGVYRVLYDLPTPELVRRHLKALERRPSRCMGGILFRYPEPAETQTVPLDALESAIRGREPAPALDIKLQASAAPWELIETGRGSNRSPIELNAVVTNRGNGATFIHPSAVRVEVHFDRPGVEEAAPHQFDDLESFCDEGKPLRSSLRHANVLRFRKLQLLPGESARIGPIRIPADGATSAFCEWQCLGTGGFKTYSGRTPICKLEPVR